MEIDPIGFRAGDNCLYRFVANNPKGFLDPLGTDKLALNDQFKYKENDGKDGTGIVKVWTDVTVKKIPGWIKLSILGGRTRVLNKELHWLQMARRYRKLKDGKEEDNFNYSNPDYGLYWIGGPDRWYIDSLDPKGSPYYDQTGGNSEVGETQVTIYDKPDASECIDSFLCKI
jgi:hypothetical protein